MKRTYKLGEYSIFPKMVIIKNKLGFVVECYSYAGEWVQNALFQELPQLREWLYRDVTTLYHADKISEEMGGNNDLSY